MARIITISNNIEDEKMKDIITNIQSWILEDDKNDSEKKNFEREIIYLMVNTNGGDTYLGLGLATMIKSSKTPIYTYGVGKIMSAGFLIFLGGHKRYCYKGSTFLYHQLSQWTDSKLNNFKRLVEQDTKLQEQLDIFVMENSKITKEQISEVNDRNHDWYISAEEAFELGLVDEIL